MVKKERFICQFNLLENMSLKHGIYGAILGAGITAFAAYETAIGARGALENKVLPACSCHIPELITARDAECNKYDAAKAQVDMFEISKPFSLLEGRPSDLMVSHLEQTCRELQAKLVAVIAACTPATSSTGSH